MTWEEAERKFRTSDSSLSILSLTGSHLGPPPLNPRSSFSQDAQDSMDLDPMQLQHTAGPTSQSEAARIRTPLPNGPRLDKPNLTPIPGWESFRTDLQGSVDRILASPSRSRYARVSVQIVRWQADEDIEGRAALMELCKVFKEEYNYAAEIISIPTSADESKSPVIWLCKKVIDFVEKENHRDTLKIFYYSGYSYLDPDRDTVLARSVCPPFLYLGSC
mgnify:CR=1 FL=1